MKLYEQMKGDVRNKMRVNELHKRAMWSLSNLINPAANTCWVSFFVSKNIQYFIIFDMMLLKRLLKKSHHLIRYISYQKRIAFIPTLLFILSLLP